MTPSHPSVLVTNISPETSQQQVKDFFAFCGSVVSVNLETDSGNTKKATVSFEKDTAASTAVLLDSTKLGPSTIQVSRLEHGQTAPSPKPESDYASERDVPQEHKPRRLIVAELLAQGYNVCDQAVSRAVDFDKQHGFSTRLDEFLRALENRFKPQEHARDLDAKYDVSGQVSKLANSWKMYIEPYVESASNTPTGVKLRKFYTEAVQSVQDVHDEAMWIKKHKLSNSCDCQNSSSLAQSSSESTRKACCASGDGEKSCSTGKGCTSGQACSSSDKKSGCACPESKCACKEGEGDCGCHANAANCPCPEGSCSCPGCPKKSKSKDCGCGASVEKCTCPVGQCSCASCPRNTSQDCGCGQDASKCPCPDDKCRCKGCAKNQFQ